MSEKEHEILKELVEKLGKMCIFGGPRVWWGYKSEYTTEQVYRCVLCGALSEVDLGEGKDTNTHNQDCVWVRAKEMIRSGDQ